MICSGEKTDVQICLSFDASVIQTQIVLKRLETEYVFFQDSLVYLNRNCKDERNLFYSIADKRLALAGYFDIRAGTSPFIIV